MNTRPNEKLSVLLADDHVLLAETLELYLRADGAFSTHRAETLGRALNKIEEHGCFDIVLLDLEMPGMGGLQGFEEVIAANSNGKVVLFSGQARKHVAIRAIEMGAAGYIPKTVTPKSLMAALRFVAAGEVYFPMDVNSDGRAEVHTRFQLTLREVQVLAGICDGSSNKSIAEFLNLSEVTIKSYVRTICAKLKAANRTQAAMIAMSSGII